jgi:regulatory protein YycI of two-component signal transduction system YycFG
MLINKIQNRILVFSMLGIFLCPLIFAQQKENNNKTDTTSTLPILKADSIQIPHLKLKLPGGIMFIQKDTLEVIGEKRRTESEQILKSFPEKNYQADSAKDSLLKR